VAWRIEPLEKRTHDHDSFTCGKPDLDNYLQQIARRAAEVGTGRTWVAIDPAAPPDADGTSPVLGYYTVAMHSVDVSVLPEDRRGGLPRAQVPAALLGRLAVDVRQQGRGLGRFLLMDALRRICNAAEHVSAYAVVLDVIDDDAKKFYARFGFLELTDNPLHLFLPIASVPQLVA
jgi:GNAT superfamily N-acetyltransferase